MQTIAAAPATADVERLIDDFRQRKPLRTGSFIVTLFGDCLAVRGGEVSLGTLIDVLAPLGISHRLVRTAVYRLVQDGVLTNAQEGRRSFYRLTDAGQDAVNEASKRIYAAQNPPWDGQWHLLILSRVPPSSRAAIRKSLNWLGFGTFGNDLLAHPHPDRDAAFRELRELDHGDKVVYMQGQLPEGGDPTGAVELIKDAWQLAELEVGYTQFIETFAPILEDAVTLGPADAFYVRTFLIHEYRRVLLRDPGLPEGLLPADWHGHAARALTGELYRALRDASERYVDERFVNRNGRLPRPDAGFARRFQR